ncbi:hypothetical protein HY967_04715 [Candidatus Jorgensenbacteria bacterium]|nr:hypothetical protein [Candidatus Jorgensenbacteria bacterium]
MKKHILIFAFVVALMISLGVSLYVKTNLGINNSTLPVITSTLTINNMSSSLIKTPIIQHIHGEFAANFADDRILLGGSHNVFVAKIIKQIGNKTQGSTPKTQFEAEVISNIKGHLQGKVIVDQFGGYRDGILYVFIEDIPVVSDAPGAGYLLQPGSTYLLATRSKADDDWHVVNSFPNVTTLISQNQNLTTTQLKTLSENNPKARQLLQAYPNEILLNIDISRNNTRNSYQSLSPGEKAQIQARIASFTPSPQTPTSTPPVAPPPPAPSSTTTSTAN